MDLTIDQIEEGRVKVIGNSWSLLHDAIILFENEKYARTYTLAHLCIEELAKLPILVGVGTEIALGYSVNWKQFNKRFRDHKSKINVHHYYDNVIFNSMGNEEDSYKQYEKDLHKTSSLNHTKNHSLYVTEQNGSFLTPDEVITREEADKKLNEACKKYDYFEELENKMQGNIKEAVDSPEYTEKFKALHEALKELA